VLDSRAYLLSTLIANKRDHVIQRRAYPERRDRNFLFFLVPDWLLRLAPPWLMPTNISLGSLLGVPQLTKEHSDELTPTTETPGMPLSAVLAHGRFELQARD
jgi:hypothetical protein